MANWTGFVLTENGQRLLAKAEAGKTLTFTKIRLGDGQVSSGQDLSKMTVLIHAKQDVGISSITPKNDGTVVISGVISNASLSTGYYVREFGLMANDPDKGEILYAVMIDSAPDYLPAKGGSVVISEQYNITMGVGNASSVTVKVDPAGLVTVEVLESKLTAEKETREQEISTLAANVAEFSNALRLVKEKTEALQGFTIETELANKQAYPFNDSIKTLALAGDRVRLNQNYTIIAEASNVTGGFLGELVISDKLLNGFKVAYTGSATSVHIKCYIQGGND